MASRDTESLSYWGHGFPVTGLNKTGNDTGSLSFWSHGFPANTLVPPAAAGGGNVKTWHGVSWSNIKTFNGKAVASVKTYNGITTQ